MAPTSKLSMGIKRASRSHAYHRRGLWAIKAKNGGVFPKAEKPAAAAEPKFYPADDVKPRVPSTRKPNPTKLRCRSHSFKSLPAWCSCLFCLEVRFQSPFVCSGRASRLGRC
jgi:hypothetical protein